jgi:hypothetical protein
MLIANILIDENIVFLSIENDGSYGANAEILSQNSYKGTCRNSSGTMYAMFNFPVKTNAKIKISFDYTKNIEEQRRFLCFYTNALNAIGGTYVSGSAVSISGIAKVHQERIVSTGERGYIGVVFYVYEGGNTLNLNIEVLVENLKIEYVE